jgi:hypothetical protein
MAKVGKCAAHSRATFRHCLMNNLFNYNEISHLKLPSSISKNERGDKRKKISTAG